MGRTSIGGVLVMAAAAFDAICDQAFHTYPLEMCGLLAGEHDGDVTVARRYYPCRNVAASAKLYSLDPAEHLRAELDAERADMDIVAVVHSHTHTEPFPSPTDIAQAPDPTWQYVIVSLKREAPELRSYRIRDATVSEEPVRVESARAG